MYYNDIYISYKLFCYKVFILCFKVFVCRYHGDITTDNDINILKYTHKRVYKIII